MPDYSSILLVFSGHKTGHIDQVDQGNIEGVTEPDEAGAFIGRIDVQAAGHNQWLVGDNTDRASIKPGEADYQGLPELGKNFHEIPLIEDLVNDFLYIVRNTKVIGNNLHQVFGGPLGVIACINYRRIFDIVEGKEAKQSFDSQQALPVIRINEMGIAAYLGVYFSSAEAFNVHLLSGNGFDHTGSGNKHLAGIFNHKNKVGDGW